MDVNIVTALIALGGVVLSTLISWIVAHLTLRYNYRQLFAETVSKSRNEWLITMRENVSVMLAEADKCQDELKTKEYYMARNEVLLRLNQSEPYCILLEQEIKLLDNCQKDDFMKTRDNIIRICQVFFKQEWEKVKNEAKGKGELK